MSTLTAKGHHLASFSTYLLVLVYQLRRMVLNDRCRVGLDCISLEKF